MRFGVNMYIIPQFLSLGIDTYSKPNPNGEISDLRFHRKIIYDYTSIFL